MQRGSACEERLKTGLLGTTVLDFASPFFILLPFQKEEEKCIETDAHPMILFLLHALYGI